MLYKYGSGFLEPTKNVTKKDGKDYRQITIFEMNM